MPPPAEGTLYDPFKVVVNTLVVLTVLLLAVHLVAGLLLRAPSPSQSDAIAFAADLAKLGFGALAGIAAKSELARP